MTDERKCENCVYWNKQEHHDEQFFGYCRRFPPTIFLVEGQHAQGQPKTPDDYWCGEFQAREDAPT